MTNIDKIRETEEQVATLQHQLDQVQVVLQKAEAVAEAGEVAKGRARQLLGVSIALVVVGVLLFVWGGRKKRAV